MARIIEELQLVKGVTPLMFKGGTAADPNSPFQHHKLGFANNTAGHEDYPFGLRDVFTPFSNGKVNLNTVDPDNVPRVLLCLPGMDANSAQAILTFRRPGDGGMNNNNGVITDPGNQQLQSLIVNPQAKQSLKSYCTVRGDTYEVHAIAQAGASQREFIAIIYRAGNHASVVGFHPK